MGRAGEAGPRGLGRGEARWGAPSMGFCAFGGLRGAAVHEVGGVWGMGRGIRLRGLGAERGRGFGDIRRGVLAPSLRSYEDASTEHRHAARTATDHRRGPRLTRSIPSAARSLSPRKLGSARDTGRPSKAGSRRRTSAVGRSTRVRSSSSMVPKSCASFGQVSGEAVLFPPGGPQRAARCNPLL